MRQLRVSGSQLLKNGLQHLGLLLYDLTELLELWVVAKEVEVSQITGTTSSSSSTCGSSCGGGGSRGSAPTSSTSTGTTTTTSLSSQVKQVHISVVATFLCWGSRGRRCGSCSCSCSLSLLLLLLNVVGDSLQEK